MLSDEHHTVTSSTVSGPMKEKAHCPKVFVFVKAIWRVLVSEMERSCLDDSLEFIKIDCVTFSERIVAQSCNIQDNGILRLLVASEVSEGGVWCVHACEL